MDISKYLEGKIANWIRGASFPAAPVSLTLALSNGDPLDDGSGLNEPTTPGYARQAIAFSPVVSDSEKSAMSNTSLIRFVPNAGQSIGAITHAVIFDNSGNMLFVGPLDNPGTFGTDTPVSFAPGILFVNLLPAFTQYLAEAILNWVRGTAMLAAPASLQLALFLSDPGFNNSAVNLAANPSGSAFTSGSGAYEIKGQGYKRQAIAFNSPTQVNGTGTTIINSAAVVFGPAGTAWSIPGLPAVAHWALCTDIGGLIVYGALTTPKIIPVGGGFGIEAGALNIVIR